MQKQMAEAAASKTFEIFGRCRFELKIDLDNSTIDEHQVGIHINTILILRLGHHVVSWETKDGLPNDFFLPGTRISPAIDISRLDEVPFEHIFRKILREIEVPFLVKAKDLQVTINGGQDTITKKCLHFEPRHLPGLALNFSIVCGKYRTTLRNPSVLNDLFPKNEVLSIVEAAKAKEGCYVNFGEFGFT